MDKDCEAPKQLEILWMLFVIKETKYGIKPKPKPNLLFIAYSHHNLACINILGNKGNVCRYYFNTNLKSKVKLIIHPN